MKISQTVNNNQNFKGLYNNKLVLNSLEKIAEHPATFIAATSFLTASVVRPVAIMSSPGVDKENKKYAIANSLASAVSKFALAEAVALPVEKAIQKIEKEPEKFLTPKTVEKLKAGTDNLLKSKKYNSVSQLLKLSPGLLTAIPKTMITVALIPVLMNLIFKNKTKRQEKNNKYDNFIKADSPNVFKDIASNSPSFKGSKGELGAKAVGKLFDSRLIQKTADKLSGKGNNMARNITVATDLLLSASFALRTQKSKNIDEKRKKPLIYNNLIGTGATLAAGCMIDNAIQKNNKNFVKKFSEINKNNPKLDKYITGLNIARPTLIFAGVYYGLFPFFSTMLADKTDKYLTSAHKHQTQNK